LRAAVSQARQSLREGLAEADAVLAGLHVRQAKASSVSSARKTKTRAAA
jgi:hypothetical protein